MNPHRSHLRRNSFVPRLEALEDRCCPTVSIGVVGQVMFITGDAANNAVTIHDAGDGTINARISGAGNEVTQTARNINAIVVNTGDGDDSVNYNLDGVLRTPLALTVLGGNGNDQIQANVGDVGAGALAFLALDGGGGNDTVRVNSQGKLDGALAALLSGGDGADTVDAHITVDPGSTGHLAATVLGGAGDDNLNLVVFDNSGPPPSSSLGFVREILDGGPGSDTASFTPDVQASNYERVPA